MATVTKTDSVTIVRYNTHDTVEISIRDADGDSVTLMHNDTKFLRDTLNAWFKEFETPYEEDE